MTVRAVRFSAHAWPAGFLPYALLAAAVFAAYATIYGNVFLYDDELLIVHNPVLRSWGDALSSFATPLSFDSSYYRPLQTLLYAIVFHAAGLSLVFFHLLNVTLHALNAALVYRLGRKLDFRPVASFLAALLWAVHPVQTEAVTYMSATADTLYSFFCLLGVLVLLPDFAPRRVLAAAALMTGGLLSKESACVFPLLAMSCLYLKDDKRFDVRTYVRLWPLAFMAAVYVGLRFALMPPHAAASPQAGAAALSGDSYPIAALLVYVRLLLWPVHLHMGYDLPVYRSLWHAALLGSLAMTSLAVFQVLYCSGRRALPLNWGLCWFTAAYLPCFFVADIFYEHWLYLPSVGLFLGIAQSLELQVLKLKPENGKPVGSGAVAIALLAALVMGCLTYRQNRIWREPVAFYNNTIEQDELAVKSHINLGVIYARRGEYEKAVAQNRIAIQNSHDTQALAQANLAIALLMLPDRAAYAEEAIEHFRRALEIDPDYYPALDELAAYYDRRGDSEKTAFYRQQAAAVRKKLLIAPATAIP